MRARQRLSKLLLRHGIVYDDTSSTWAPGTAPGCAPTISATAHRRRLLDTSARPTRSGAAAASSSGRTASRPTRVVAHTIARLRSLRAIDTLSAVGVATEIADFGRFDRSGS
jgi:transposase